MPTSFESPGERTDVGRTPERAVRLRPVSFYRSRRGRPYPAQDSPIGAPFFESQPAPAHIVLPTIYQNLMHGEAHGIEAFGNWNVLDRWTLSPGYAFQVTC